jgi:hypothetical membrane protein
MPREGTTRGERLTRRLLAAGIVGPALFVVVLLIEGATRPGYDAWRQFGSELSLSDQGWEQIANFLICGVLCLAFAVGLRRALRRARGAVAGPVALAVFGLALVVAGIFTTDPALGYPPGAAEVKTMHGAVHALAGLFVFVSLTVACFVLAWRFARDARSRGWTVYSALSGLVVLAFFIASVVPSGPGAPIGLLQRVAIVAGWAWIVALAGHLRRRMVQTPGLQAVSAPA